MGQIGSAALARSSNGATVTLQEQPGRSPRAAKQAGDVGRQAAHVEDGERELEVLVGAVSLDRPERTARSDRDARAPEDLRDAVRAHAEIARDSVDRLTRI